MATLLFEHILSFSVAFNTIEPIKPLVTKLQKRIQDIYRAYQIIDNVLRESKNYRDDMDNEFQHRYSFAVRICKDFGIEPGLPRLAKCWSRYRLNVENDGTISYYKRTVAIPFLDDINFQLSERLKDQNHVETFTLLPSKIFSESYSIEETAKSLQAKYQREMANDGCHFRSELERWYNFWKDKVEHQQDQLDSIIETLEFADLNFFPNICRLLPTGAVSPIGSTKAERAVSGIRKLKTAFRSPMADRRESDLNLLQMHQITTVNFGRVVNMFIKQHPRSLFNPTMFSE